MAPVVVEVFVFAIIVIVAFTQVLLPAITNTPLFPSFRFKKQHRKLSDARAAIEAAELDAEATAERRLADHIRQETRSQKREADPSCSTHDKTSEQPADAAPVSPAFSPSDSPSSR